MKDFNYDEYVERNKKCAQIVWDNAFFSGLWKLKKEDLINIISALVSKLNLTLEPDQDLFWKDVAFNEKCLIIEVLNKDFFKGERK